MFCPSQTRHFSNSTLDPQLSLYCHQTEHIAPLHREASREDGDKEHEGRDSVLLGRHQHVHPMAAQSREGRHGRGNMAGEYLGPLICSGE